MADGYKITRHLGTYGGYDVFCEEGMLQVLRSFTVAGKTFRGSHSFEIYVARAARS